MLQSVELGHEYSLPSELQGVPPTGLPAKVLHVYTIDVHVLPDWYTCACTAYMTL